MKLWKLIMTGVVTLGLAGVFVTAPTPVTAQASDGVSIDGDFSDWKDADVVEGNNQNASALKNDGQYLDMYVKMEYGGIPQNGNYLLTIDGKTYYLMPKNMTGSVSAGESKAFSLVAGTWNGADQYGTVGSGYVSNVKSHNVAEFRVDLTKLKLSQSADGKEASFMNYDIGSNPAKATINWSGSADSSSSVAASGGTIDGKSDESSKGTTPTDSNANNDNDNLNIKIDGKFEDWKDVDLTEGYDGYTAMVSDGDYVYVYVQMKDNDVLPGTGDYNFDIGGKQVYVSTKHMPNNVKEGDAEPVSFVAGKWQEGDQYGTVGNGYSSTNKNGHNILEFRVDLRKLDVSTMTGQTITMYNPNIGDKKVSVAGGSTGPYIISGIGLAIAGLGYLKFRKSGKAKHKDDPTLTK
ncbi:Firmicu-CTERM sorting domain-containing protein [Levilactobacillus fuyuanensis]|uniref:Firmicu-CTERM sorting domain-containing protein n=1 Tax=Levilactobacillus fuyuanensis TaxID=2486022 RepID=A0ABW4H6J7_9LACO|nr:Firmicu-CTERM sorting domain-containing protein [Levilactobacillus fuyuanensis]